MPSTAEGAHHAGRPRDVHRRADPLRASRCLSCGRSVVDPNKCIGCGICTTKCEFDAIHLKRVRPQNSKMIPAEDKFKAIGPYAAKRQVKIIKKSLAEKKK
ncbi:MAG: 4Fe-4S binding protein [Oscillospiraceae bacterium]